MVFRTSCLLLFSVVAPTMAQYIETRIRTDSGPCAVAVNARRNRVYVGDNFIFGHEGAIEIIDAVDNRIVRTICSGYFCNKVLYNPVADRAYGNMQIGGLVVIDGTGDSMLRAISVGATINELCLDTVGNRLFIQDCIVPSTLFVLDCSADTLLAVRFTIRRVGRGLLCDAPGRKVYCLDDSCRLLVIDADSLAVVDTVAVSPGAEEMAYSPFLRRLYVSSYTGGTIDVVDCVADTLMATIQLSGPRRMLWQPRDDQVYVCRYLDNSLAVVDCSTNTVIRYISVGGWQEQACYVPTTHAVFCITGTGVAAIDCASFSVRAMVELGRMAQDIAWSPYLDRIYVPNLGTEVVVIREVVPGIDGGPPTCLEHEAPEAGVVRGVLNIPGSPPAGTWLFDMTGRPVTSLSPGPNDVRHLAPGVYFAREQPAAGVEHSGPSAVRKIMLLR